MNYLQNFHNTDFIAAITTGGGMSAVAIIRCSGNGIIDKIETIFQPQNKNNKLSTAKGYCQILGNIIDKDTLIDQVLLSIFRNPNSFTGEDIVEINCHGSVYIQKEILVLLNKIGIRPAAPGEFTMRAWSNGKYDLAQAEAIADLINSNNEFSHQLAMKQLKGHYSTFIKQLREEFIGFAALIELELDFAEEEVEFADRTKFLNLIAKLQSQITQLLESYTLGKVLKNGIPVSIVGKPNVGKSTLLNLLLKDDKAITSEIPGTTRDIIEDTITVNNYLFRFIDTAGIRESSDTIENLGIERTYKAINESSIIIYVTDETGFGNDETEIFNTSHFESKHIIKVQNKVDKKIGVDKNENQIIKISALKGHNIEELTKSLMEYVEMFKINDQTIVTSERHAHLLRKTLEDLKRISEGFDNNIPSDLIMIDVKSAMNNLSDITGEIVVDDLLTHIFSKFCIGK